MCHAELANPPLSQKSWVPHQRRSHLSKKKRLGARGCLTIQARPEPSLVLLSESILAVGVRRRHGSGRKHHGPEILGACQRRSEGLAQGLSPSNPFVLALVLVSVVAPRPSPSACSEKIKIKHPRSGRDGGIGRGRSAADRLVRLRAAPRLAAHSGAVRPHRRGEGCSYIGVADDMSGDMCAYYSRYRVLPLTASTRAFQWCSGTRLTDVCTRVDKKTKMPLFE